MRSLFGSGVVQMTLESLSVLGLRRGGLRSIGQHLAVELVFVLIRIRAGFFEGQGVLGSGEAIELGLGLVAEKAGELGERDRLFGCVNDGFDLCFKAHGLVGVLLSIPRQGVPPYCPAIKPMDT